MFYSELLCGDSSSVSEEGSMGVSWESWPRQSPVIRGRAYGAVGKARIREHSDCAKTLGENNQNSIGFVSQLKDRLTSCLCSSHDIFA